MVVLIGLALASSGSKQCRFRGLPATVIWTDSGDVRVKDGNDLLVSANVGPLKGTTSATCLPEGVKFLTDTHERPGDFTLNTVNMKITAILDTLDSKRFENRDPKSKPKPKPKRAVRAPPEPEPVKKPDAVVDAQSCVQTTVAESYAQGWGSRSLLADELPPRQRRNLRVTLYANTDYRVDVCGDRTVTDIDVWLVNDHGILEAADRTDARQGRLEFRPPTTGVYYVVLEVADRDETVGAAVALSYR